jgi:hypothetical protein
MDIDTITNFLSETNDRLLPFNRTYKTCKSLNEISSYLKINLKPNISLHEISKDLKVNIMFVNENLEFITFSNNNYDKWICLIKHQNGYEPLHIKQKFIINHSEISNLKINNFSDEHEDEIEDEDDDEDYREIDTNITIDEDTVIQTEDLKSVKDIMNKELYNDLQELLIDTIEMENNILEPIKNDKQVLNKKESEKNESNKKESDKNELVKLQKMVKDKLVTIIMDNDKSLKKTILSKNTKDKLIELIITNRYKY